MKQGRGKRLTIIRNTAVVTATMLLAACGGGGVNSSGSNAPSTGAPAPTPMPTPTPPPTAADSAEYKASAGVAAMKAAYAYDKGITGKGVTIAIVDTGIDTAGSEFAGRISPDSTSFDQKIARCRTCQAETVRFDLKDVDGHGTGTAAIALAARDGRGMQGVAPDATLLALKIAGPDMTNVTETSGPVPQGGGPNSALIGPAVTYAVNKGAFVISMSLNGSSAGQAAIDQRAAMDLVRTQNKLVVQSVSNFVDENSFSGQVTETMVGSDLANKDWFLFGIRVDKNLQPPSGNGMPGPLADRMLAVVAADVAAVGKDGEATTVTGNSFAAPAIAGAAALLKQYWPQLGGKEISRILLDTATDLGAAGVDEKFGAGLLNVEKAMQAQAPATAFAAAQTVLARYSSLSMSAPFGGAAGAAALGDKVADMTVLDRYGRHFHMQGASGIRAQSSGLLAGVMLTPVDPPWLMPSTTDARFGFLSPATTTGYWQGARSNRPAFASFSPVPGQTVMLGANVAIGQSAAMAGSPLRGIGATPVGMSSSWASGGWSASFASGISRDRRTGQRTIAVTTPLGIGMELTNLAEHGRALGMSGGLGLGLAGATTTMATLTMRRTIAGVALSARSTAATTRVSGGSALMRFDEPVFSTAFAVEGSRGLLSGMATLGLSSPLRVERARATMLVPVTYDLMSGALATRMAVVDLAPSARELDIELGWSAALSPMSSLRFGIARAFDAGHVAGATDTAGYVTLVLR
ncbi:S8 family serine peptidase [Sphingomonas sp. SORGH_AS_0438]|uniref:S8 family serine peptidase n=1 Tax=Sphingomonas sp. SORGH_AS_0438 TaxID=3041756 RepID=UPI002856370B|nr:S8 family serine peptidase [Sphingomonas sp. SORGH_AS_0438]MDR6127099.1 subtilisin family serine protease [Sphingomonas sp. SORGH_AS_0438]